MLQKFTFSSVALLGVGQYSNYRTMQIVKNDYLDFCLFLLTLQAHVNEELF